MTNSESTVNTIHIAKNNGNVVITDLGFNGYTFSVFDNSDKPLLFIDSMYGFPESDGTKFTDFKTLVAAISAWTINEIIEKFRTEIKDDRIAV